MKPGSKLRRAMCLAGALMLTASLVVGCDPGYIVWARNDSDRTLLIHLSRHQVDYELATGAAGILVSGLGDVDEVTAEVRDPETCVTLAALTIVGSAAYFVIGADEQLSSERLYEGPNTFRSDLPQRQLPETRNCQGRVRVPDHPTPSDGSPPAGRFVFVSGWSESIGERKLWVVDADGSGLREIVELNDFVRDAAFSSDGTLAAIVKFRPGEDGETLYDTDIEVIDVDAGVTVATIPGAFAPQWHPYQLSLAFQSGQPAEADAPIDIAEADGSGRRRSADPGGLMTWSPDGKWLVFGAGYGETALRLVAVDGGQSRTLTTADLVGRDPDWSPDNGRIALSGVLGNSGDDQSDIFVVDVESGQVTHLTRTRSEVDAKPKWSPDGELIAFSRSGANTNEVVVIDPLSMDQNVVVESGSWGGPHLVGWSPDGAWLAYLTGDSYEFGDLHAVRTDGTGHRVMVTGIDGDWVRWVPDSN